MDRHVAMETFVRVIDTGSFSGAARQIQHRHTVSHLRSAHNEISGSPSLDSKLVVPFLPEWSSIRPLPPDHFLVVRDNILRTHFFRLVNCSLEMF